MNFVSAVCLFVLALVCTCGVFSTRFHENWLQFVGLVMLCLWSVSRLLRVLDGEPVSEFQLMAHIGLASFAAGTAIQVLLPRSARNLLGIERRRVERRELR